MTQTVETGIGSVEKSEDELWTEYMVVLARAQCMWAARMGAYRDWVVGGRANSSLVDVWNHIEKLYAEWSEREQAAYRAWVEVAYPANGLSLPKDNK